MVRRVHGWETRFGQWVSAYSVADLTADLFETGCPITRSAVYSWMGGGAMPRVEHVRAIERLSGGTLTAQDVHEHVLTVRGSSPPGYDAGPGGVDVQLAWHSWKVLTANGLRT